MRAPVLALAFLTTGSAVSLRRFADHQLEAENPSLIQIGSSGLGEVPSDAVLKSEDEELNKIESFLQEIKTNGTPQSGPISLLEETKENSGGVVIAPPAVATVTAAPTAGYSLAYPTTVTYGGVVDANADFNSKLNALNFQAIAHHQLADELKSYPAELDKLFDGSNTELRAALDASKKEHMDQGKLHEAIAAQFGKYAELMKKLKEKLQKMRDLEVRYKHFYEKQRENDIAWTRQQNILTALIFQKQNTEALKKRYEDEYNKYKTLAEQTAKDLETQRAELTALQDQVKSTSFWNTASTTPSSPSTPSPP
uniref:Uncharacterized protein n=1 Tax=Chromera velia CCMP2878 TaxID=1169474 RepID=A0A0G4FYD2_9ALVE|eukprot:Cvel_19390.t1-p1 / transcript=Cvel_19390.t1 / gene=Cvel_19390 / organism=Chromera_velia_CCMP2878 / gene_product=hypothetical protein / transcript_product=hypothetical protein / location=Cvel_scaffold1668:8898-9827(-) / protein_length=310 / sequence_SO=supercontig / SO=protein_coding / is_pseudo=false